MNDDYTDAPTRIPAIGVDRILCSQLYEAASGPGIPEIRSFDAMSTGERSDFIDSEKRQSQIAVSKSKSREVMKMGRS